jgi:hypothetical protein
MADMTRLWGVDFIISETSKNRFRESLNQPPSEKPCSDSIQNPPHGVMEWWSIGVMELNGQIPEKF